jgi:hypothetical protein
VSTTRKLKNTIMTIKKKSQETLEILKHEREGKKNGFQKSFS